MRWKVYLEKTFNEEKMDYLEEKFPFIKSKKISTDKKDYFSSRFVKKVAKYIGNQKNVLKNLTNKENFLKLKSAVMKAISETVKGIKFNELMDFIDEFFNPEDYEKIAGLVVKIQNLKFKSFLELGARMLQVFCFSKDK